MRMPAIVQNLINGASTVLVLLPSPRLALQVEPGGVRARLISEFFTQSDGDALSAAWRAVGGDLRTAMDVASRELPVRGEPQQV